VEKNKYKNKYMNNECDYILLILNCYKYKFKATIQKQSWIKNISPINKILYFHIRGDKEKCGDKNYIIDISSNTIYTKTNDDYSSLPHKMITAIEAIDKTFHYKYIFKTYDDLFLINNYFFDIIIKTIDDTIKLNNKVHYGGKMIEIKNNTTRLLSHEELSKDLKVNIKKTYYCDGTFYFLSKEAITSLLKKKKLISKEVIEDYAIGYHLNSEYKNCIYHFNVDNFFVNMF
jgi:hypothetical protein